MKLSDLKSGYFVQLRNEEYYVMIDNFMHCWRDGAYIALADYMDDFKYHSRKKPEWDIVRVFQPDDGSTYFSFWGIRDTSLTSLKQRLYDNFNTYDV